jgi:SAM-dependent methyltransferase
MTRTPENFAVAGQGELPFAKPVTKDARNHRPGGASLSSKLKDVLWDFPERVAHSDIEGLHPYPAKFVAELPRALLNILPIPAGTVVLDPFCGSGTTLVECQRREVPSFGIDLNPIACLMARVKTAPLPPGLADSINAVLTRAQIMNSGKPPSRCPMIQLALSNESSSMARSSSKNDKHSARILRFLTVGVQWSVEGTLIFTRTISRPFSCR